MGKHYERYIEKIIEKKLNPKLTLIEDNPHMIDEWQKVSDTWNYVKEDLDIKYEFGNIS